MGKQEVKIGGEYVDIFNSNIHIIVDEIVLVDRVRYMEESVLYHLVNEENKKYVVSLIRFENMYNLVNK